jgi:pimeloyl-ACP methyl ester carboxylesterase
MRLYHFIIVVLIFLTAPLYSQVCKYPQEDFYNRNIQLPIDYENPAAGTFSLYYQLTSNFDFNRPTIIFFYDGQQEYGRPGKVDDLAKEYDFFEFFNVVRYQYRGRKYSYIELKNSDGTVNWEKAYRVMSSEQAVEDIERIRQDLFKDRPDTKVFVYGRSGGGYLIQRYLAKYSKNVKRAFIESAPHPIIMKQLGNPESKYLYNLLMKTNPALNDKLNTVLGRKIVPDLNLLWILKGIPYKSKNPKGELAKLINELYQGKKSLYEQYLRRQGFDFSKALVPEKKMSAWEIGGVLVPVEFILEYKSGPEPNYVDPLYACLGKASEPYIRLIEEKKVEAPVPVPLEKFKEVETEVFWLTGKNDHVSPYQVGIELGNYFKNYELFIADDNHNLTIHKGCYLLLRNAFFQYGIGSKKLQEVRNCVKCKEWTP